MAEPGALAGVRIVDFSPTIGGLATSALADLGAEVTHVGRPSLGGVLEPVGRNKRSIALDLKSERGLGIAQALIAEADVVVEGFRPGVAQRLGISYEHARQLRPEIVYCALSGYGQDGPYRSWPGHDLNYQGVAGSIQFDEQDRPVMPSGPWSDRTAGFHLQLAVLSGLFARERHGTGSYIDVALVDATITVPLDGQYSVPGVGRMPTGAMSGSSLPQTPMIRGDYCWYGLYECSDGRWLSLACLEPQFWSSLCKHLGREEWLPAQFAGLEQQAAMRAEIAAVLVQRPRSAWLDELIGQADLPVAPVHRPEDVPTDPQLAHRGAVLATTLPGGQPMAQVAPPLHTGAAFTLWRSMTVSGMDTDAVLRDLGRSEAEIRELHEDGVVHTAVFPQSHPEATDEMSATP